MRLLIVLSLIVLGVNANAQEDGHSDAARASLMRGVEASNAGRYLEAEKDFQSAVDIEPSWQMAHLYLGMALAYEVVPNLDTPENIGIANRALEQFDQILASNPQDLAALRQVAAIQRNIKRFDDAMASERKILGIDPNDAEAHCTIAVIEWNEAYKFTMETLAGESLRDDGVGNVKLSAAGCSALTAHNARLVDDGIAELSRAVELRPTYDDAMQYLNLMYRQKASLDCANAELRQQDLGTANEWIQRAVTARRANEQEKMRQLGSPPLK